MALGSLQPTHLGAARPRAPKAAASPARCLARSPAAPLVVGAGRVRGASVSRPAGRAGLLVAAVVTVRGVECPEWRALEKEGWVLLDVRPPEEVERVRNAAPPARCVR